MITEFALKADGLERKLAANNLEQDHEGKRTRPRCAVVISLYEGSTTGLTSKMFSHSLESILQQAKDAGIDLDFIIVENNGGGTTNKEGDELHKSILDNISLSGGHPVELITSKPSANPRAQDP